MTALVTTHEGLTEALSAHRYRDVLGDYEVAPYYMHFGCTCGWEQNIAGMNGWRSWIAAHEAHVAAAVLASGAVVDAATLADDTALVEAVAADQKEAADSWGEPLPGAERSFRARTALRALAAALKERGVTR